MNALPIHITAHDIELSLGLRKFIDKKISRVSRFAADILSAEVVLREKSGANGVFSVSARLALPGRDVHANAVHVNFYAAINQLVGASHVCRASEKHGSKNANAALEGSGRQPEGQSRNSESAASRDIVKTY